MKLSDYEGRKVRLICKDGGVYEGLAGHNSVDYNYHEYGVDEEGISISYFLFYKSDIEDIRIVDEFANPYGLIEELTISDGFDLVEQTLTGEDDTAIIRLLECLRKYLDPDSEEKIKYENEVLELLKTQLKYYEDEKIKMLTEDILNRR
ncbi:MAG: hypothetical protein IKE38_02285 [Erysipelotrichaceae bacterium]|nr:hypothetical protein [Erysipelotrichaceae bacterium]